MDCFCCVDDCVGKSWFVYSSFVVLRDCGSKVGVTWSDGLVWGSDDQHFFYFYDCNGIYRLIYS